MEQKTEASQAVDELLPPLPEKTLHNFDVYAHDDEAMRSYALAAIHRYAMKVAAMITHPFPVIDLKAPPAPTEAAQFPNTPEIDALLAKWDDDGATRGAAFIELRDKARQIERAFYAAVEQVRTMASAAQGEDSARLECAHANGRTASWDWVTCDDCGAIYTGSGEREWGVAQNMWFKDVSEAKFYKENGRYPDRARASVETGGVKP